MDKWATYMADPSLLAYSQPSGPAKAATCAVPTLAPSSGGYAYYPPPYALQWPGMWGANGRCVASKVAASGVWCPDAQPAYSAWREDVYGAGILDFVSPTEAVWSFYSQGTAMVKPADSVVIKRNPTCALKAAAADGTLDVSLKAGMASKLNGMAARVAGVDVAVLDAVDARVAGWANSTGALDVTAGASGGARQAASAVAAKVGAANFTVMTLANTLRNKTG
jgi:hypothetical protein